MAPTGTHSQFTSRRLVYCLFVSLLTSVAFAANDAESVARRPPHTGPAPSIHFGAHQSPASLESSPGDAATDRAAMTHRPRTDTVGPLATDHSFILTQNLEKVTTRSRGTLGPLNNGHEPDRNEITTGTRGTLGPLSKSTADMSRSTNNINTVSSQTDASHTQGTTTDAESSEAKNSGSLPGIHLPNPIQSVRRTNARSSQKVSTIIETPTTTLKESSVEAVQDATQKTGDSTTTSSVVVETPSPTPAPIVTGVATIDNPGEDGESGALGIGLPANIENWIRHAVPDDTIPWAPWWWWLVLSGAVFLACCTCCVCKCAKMARPSKSRNTKKLQAQLAEEAAGHHRSPSNLPIHRPPGLNFYHYDDEPGFEDYEDSYPDTRYEDYQHSWSEFDHKLEQDGRQCSLTDSRCPPYSPRRV